MRLSDYITQHGDSECSKRFGVKERTVASWRRGERTPRPAQARKIISGSGGDVSMSDIYAAETLVAA